MVFAEGELQLTFFRDLFRVGHRVRISGEQRLHLLCGTDIKIPRLIPHSVLVIHRLAGLDAQQHVVIFCILLPQIVGIIGTHQGYPRFVVQPQKTPVHLGLLGDAVVL